MTTRHGVTDALELRDRRFPPTLEELADRRRLDVAFAVGEEIYRIRSEAGLSQRALAKKIGTSASVICRLEHADYEGHSMSMLHRIAAALGKRVEVRFVDDPAPARPTAGDTATTPPDA